MWSSSRNIVLSKDNGGFAWGVLGFLIPLVGLILFLVWKDLKPKTAKAVGIGALVNVVFIVIIFLLLIIITLSITSIDAINTANNVKTANVILNNVKFS